MLDTGRDRQHNLLRSRTEPRGQKTNNRRGRSCAFPDKRVRFEDEDEEEEFQGRGGPSGGSRRGPPLQQGRNQHERQNDSERRTRRTSSPQEHQVDDQAARRQRSNSPRRPASKEDRVGGDQGQHQDEDRPRSTSSGQREQVKKATTAAARPKKKAKEEEESSSGSSSSDSDDSTSSSGSGSTPPSSSPPGNGKTNAKKNKPAAKANAQQRKAVGGGDKDHVEGRDENAGENGGGASTSTGPHDAGASSERPPAPELTNNNGPVVQLGQMLSSSADEDRGHDGTSLLTGAHPGAGPDHPAAELTNNNGQVVAQSGQRLSSGADERGQGGNVGDARTVNGGEDGVVEQREDRRRPRDAARSRRLPRTQSTRGQQEVRDRSRDEPRAHPLGDLPRPPDRGRSRRFFRRSPAPPRGQNRRPSAAPRPSTCQRTQRQPSASSRPQEREVDQRGPRGDRVPQPPAARRQENTSPRRRMSCRAEGRGTTDPQEQRRGDYNRPNRRSQMTSSYRRQDHRAISRSRSQRVGGGRHQDEQQYHYQQGPATSNPAGLADSAVPEVRPGDAWQNALAQAVPKCGAPRLGGAAPGHFTSHQASHEGQHVVNSLHVAAQQLEVPIECGLEDRGYLTAAERQHQQMLAYQHGAVNTTLSGPSTGPAGLGDASEVVDIIPTWTTTANMLANGAGPEQGDDHVALAHSAAFVPPSAGGPVASASAASSAMNYYEEPQLQTNGGSSSAASSKKVNKISCRK
ncbi:unnamed protein product [Amoebophrya sp. A120]|nr:unnamed protein product [Amoebophrya sp. A120]|eukprot:GSA120T00020539001.1